MSIPAFPAFSRTSSQRAAEGVGPSRVMEIALHVLVFGLLGVSIIGIAFVYGFNLQTGSFLDNLSAAIRALGVDGGFFLGLYFSRRLWMRKKYGWWDGLKTTLFGGIWFGVALLMAALSWFSNTLFVTSFQTIITQGLLNRAGFSAIPPEFVNKAIGAIPLVIVLLYSIVPRQTQVQIETRTPEEIEREARQEAARIRAQNLVAAARAEGAGQRLRQVVGGVVGQALNLEERSKRDERLKQMRIALETAGYPAVGMSDERVEIQVVARGLWDQKKDEAIKPKAAQARTTDAPLRLPETEGEETNDSDDQEGAGPAGPAASGAMPSWLDASAVAAFLEVSRQTAKKWMEPDWNGPYHLVGCRNVDVKQGNRVVRVRRAPLKAVSEVKKRLDAARHSKNGTTAVLIEASTEQAIRNEPVPRTPD